MDRDYQKSQKYWNKIARKYDSFMERFDSEYDVLISKIREHLKSDDKVLEVAAGTANISLGVCDAVSHIVATDFSESMLKVALKKALVAEIRNVAFEIQNVASLSFENETFDVCVMVNALHVVPQPEKAIDEILRILKPGGRLIIPTYCHGESLKSRIVSGTMKLFGFQLHSSYSMKSLVDFISGMGFRVTFQQVLSKSTPPIGFVVALKR